MKREIEFRGISTHTGNLVYGNYFHNFRKGESFNIIPFDTNEWIKVIPETIGQYTGLKDKNLVKIFEGDILQRDIIWNDKKIGESIVSVIFKDGQFMFLWDRDKTITHMFYLLDGFFVIGNIHQNKELLP